METLMQVPQGAFELMRLPYRKNDTLRAWDAADEYVLKHLATTEINQNATVLILNDSFGALGVALNTLHPQVITDSFLSQQATNVNLDSNGIARGKLTLLNSLQLPDKKIDFLLIKIPKTLALLEYQLIRLQPWLTAETQVIAAGMTKSLPESVWKLLERLLGPTTTSLAKKKARLIQVVVNPQRVVPDNPYPLKYQLKNTNFTICNHANVFSRDSLDVGTRFLLRHLPDNPAYREMIDLGCGNGVVGLMFAHKHPEANIRFIDESFMAIASAKENFEQAFDKQRQAQFIMADCLTGVDENSADCIVCNPPFHQQHTVGNYIALKMFRQSRKVLKKGGELRVIGNRHLKYHISLKQQFGRCEIIASNNKFVILKCVK